MKMRRKKNVKKGVLFSLMVCGASGTGRLNMNVSKEPVVDRSKVAQLLSTPSVGSRSYTQKTQMTQPMLISKKASGSSQSQLVRASHHNYLALYADSVRRTRAR